VEAGSHKSPAPRKKNDFIIVNYEFDDNGAPDIEVPSAAPCGGSGDCCRVGRHSIRHRKSGPCHGLVVVRCATHKRFFTLYPPGFAPYLRGSLEAEPSVFSAASDAAEGKAWPRPPFTLGAQSWRTQTRKIVFAGTLLGLGDVGPWCSDVVAQALEVPLHVHGKAAKEFATGGYRCRGQAVMRVIAEVSAAAQRRSRSSTTPLYNAGFVTGVWGRAWHVGRAGDDGVSLHPVFRL